jgi:DNA-directed RNA polymerase subunit RPC12/RpoP
MNEIDTCTSCDEAVFRIDTIDEESRLLTCLACGSRFVETDSPPTELPLAA